MNNLRGLWSGSMLMGISMMTMMQNAPIVAVLFGASFTDVGFMMGFVRNLPYVVLSPLTAYLLSRISWNMPLPLSGLLMVVSTALMYVASDLVSVLLSQLVMGVAMFCFFPCGESIVSQSYGESGRLKAFSLFLSAVSGGFLLGSILSGVVAYLFGIRQIFALAAALSAMACILFTRTKTQQSTTINTNIKPEIKTTFPILYSTPYFLILAASYAVFPGYLVLQGFTELDVGLLFFALMLSRVLTSYSLSRIKPEKVKKLLTILSGVTALTLLITAYNPSQLMLHAVLLILVGAVVSIAYVLTLYLISGKPGGQNPVLLIGMFEALIGSSFLVGPLLAGFLTDFYGFTSALLVFGMSMIVGGVFSVRQRV
ncbi:MAG: MFS transporter [Candidatus Caldarchaeum sp.]|nr:MFS transporter [Candidatus Caldarchaeum sp.]